MKAKTKPVWFTTAILSIAVSSKLLHPLAAAAQTVPLFDGVQLPLPAGATASTARGMSERGWEPLTVVGTVEGTVSSASCWIRTSQQWTAHVLPGLDPNAASWANAVDHVPVDQGEWTLVVGAAVCSTGSQRPMKWDNVKNEPWSMHQLPTLSGGKGEALALFLPDGTPTRALIGGWADEALPTTANTRTIGLRTIVIWEVTPTGERIMRPDFGAGLEAYANDIASSGPGLLFAVGGGENSSGVWKPQLWTSVDDGETWSNEELPLPLGVESGEVVDGRHEVGHWLGAGYGLSTSGRQVPLLWDLDTGVPTPAWVVHELPLPTSDEGGQNSYVHKLPGRTTFVSVVLKGGISPEMGVWVDDASGGWTLFGPAEYLSNPGIGTPVSPAGIDKYGRIAVKFPAPAPAATPAASAQTGDTAGILIPSPATGIEGRRSVPRLITVSAAPNPFNSGVRIDYALPWDASATVTVHDVRGAVVATLDQAQLAAGRERVVRWNGITRGGERAASGVYFVRVETPYAISTMKIVRVE